MPMCEKCYENLDSKYRPDIDNPQWLCDDCYEKIFDTSLKAYNDSRKFMDEISKQAQIEVCRSVPHSRTSERYEKRKYTRRMG